MLGAQIATLSPCKIPRFIKWVAILVDRLSRSAKDNVSFSEIRAGFAEKFSACNLISAGIVNVFNVFNLISWPIDNHICNTLIQ